MLKRTHRFVYFLFLLVPLALSGQTTSFIYQKVGEGDRDFGKRSQVEVILQDRNGFIWVGFLDGLVRYDGQVSRSFFHNPKDTTSISGNFISNLLEDKEGNIWVSTHDGGLDKIDTRTEQITRFSKGLPKVNKGYFLNITEASNDELLLGGELGFYRFDKRLGLFEKLDDTKYYKVVHPYKDSLFMVINSVGGQLYNPRTKSLGPLDDPILRQSDSLLRYVNEMLTDPEGLYWFASPDHGVLQYNPKTQTFRRFCEEKKRGCDGGLFTTQLVEDFMGNIWVGGKEGLKKYDKEKDAFVTLSEKEPHTESPLSNRVKALLIDRNQNLWIGNKLGLFVSRLNVKKFSSYLHIEGDSTSLPNKSIFSLYLDDKDYLWAASYGAGLIRLHLPTGKVNQYTRGKVRQEGKIYTDDLLSVTSSKDGTLWVGTEIGLHRAQRVGNDELDFTYFRNPVIRGNYVYDVKARPNGNIWIGSAKGLFEFDPQQETFSYFPSTDSIYQATLFVLEEGQKLWIGTSGNGLISHDIATGVRHKYLVDPTDSTAISNNRVNHVLKDPSGCLWVSTGLGLNLFDPQSRTFETYLDADGLPGNFVNAVFVDKNGHVWVSTLNGMSKLTISRKNGEKPIVKNIRNYFEEDGMGASGYNFGAYEQNEEGEIFVATSGVVTRFFPEEITESSEEASVILTEFKVLNEPWDGPLKVPALKEVELDYFQNFFSISFSSLDYLTPGNTQFAYKLKGVDQDWVVSKRQYAGYTQVKPGTYQFEVKARNRDGVWGPSASLLVTVRTPFWLSWWFLTLVTVCILGLGYFIINLRNRQLDSQRAKEMAEQSAQHKADFLANMSHEIRTPMNAVVGTMHLLRNTSLTAKQQRYVETVRHSAENLLVIINDILDFSKIEAGKLGFQHKAFRPREVSSYLSEVLAHRAQQNETLLTVTCAPAVPEVLIGDSTRLVQILLNLGSNAVKFTEEGQVDIDLASQLLSQTRAMLQVKVADTGVGISAEKLPYIFDSFEQGGADVGREFGGTGLGLAIAKRLVEDQGGKISVESEEGVGTTFYFEIPFEIGHTQLLEEKQEITSEEVLGKKIKILLVEDNHLNREIATELIEQMIEQVELDSVENGQKAIERLEQSLNYDVILMDIKMPVMDGLACTEHIREHFPAPINRTPIIALTATATEEEVQRCLEIGMNDFLSKPFDPKELCEKILKLSGSQ